MRIVTSARTMQALARRWRAEGVPVGFVPTMGYLHDGHGSLIGHARRNVGPQGKVVVSIYVNPTQFAPHEDLARYPRDLPGDRRRCEAAGVDVLFVPSDAAMYSRTAGAEHSTYVVEESLARLMEGVTRPTHFRGVTTIVAKLFNLTLPTVAVFGAKDYQQAAIIQRMVRDLNFPVRIRIAPTVREPDGLALSSRNKYLSPEDRAQATVLWKSIRSVRAAVRRSPNGCRATRLRSRVARLVAQHPPARLDYVAFFDPRTLRPVRWVRRGSQMALAVYLGCTRLIDNGRV